MPNLIFYTVETLPPIKNDSVISSLINCFISARFCIFRWFHFTARAIGTEQMRYTVE